MNKAIYRQADSRWGSLPYPTKAYSFAGNGCGCCACTHLIIEIPKYSKYTPKKVRPYMVKQGFATLGNGTTWMGITKTLEHYGFAVAQPSTMAKAWELLDKKGSPKMGILLFRAGTRNGITWTTGGHYVAFLKYKKVNGKHYFYTKDSGGRHHDGWYCYETEMQGLIPNIWVVTKKPSDKIAAAPKKVIPKPKKNSYSGAIPKNTLKKGSKGANVKYLQTFLNWYGYYGLKVDGKYGAKTISAVKSFQKKEKLVVDGIYGVKCYKAALAYKKKAVKKTSNTTTKKTTTKKTTTKKTTVKKTNAQKICDQMKALAWPLGTDKKKWQYSTGAPREACRKLMNSYGYTTREQKSDCGYFVNTVVRSAGISKTFKSLPSRAAKFSTKVANFDIVIKGRMPKDSELKPGDIIRYKKTKGSQHVLMYYGNGVLCEAGRKIRFGRFLKNNHKYGKSDVRINTLQVLRVKEK